MDGADHVGVEGGLVGELHGAAELVAVRAGGDVDAGEGVEQAGGLALEGEDVGEGAGFIGLVWLRGFQRKRKMWMNMR